jgi:hypothetical protein
MPKRKKSSDAGVNMDVMMDSMTNVVGVLLLILILIQIQISTAVETIETKLKNVTAKDVKLLESKIAEQNKDLEGVDVQEINEEYKKAMGDVDEAQLRVKIYTEDAEKSTAGLLDVKELIARKSEKKYEKELEAEIFSDLNEERQRLDAMLAKTPKPKIPGGVDIIVPAGLPLPKSPTYVKIMCRYNKLYYMRDSDYAKTANAAFERMKSSMVYSNYIDANKRPITIYDHDKAYKWLQSVSTNLNTANTNLTVKAHQRKDLEYLYINLIPDPKGGMAMSMFEERNNQFRKDVIAAKRNTKNVLWFYVHADSLEVYLKARDVAQSLGIPVGWEFYRWSGFTPRLSFKVNRLVAPRKPTIRVAGRAKNSAIQIAGPKKTLD